MKFLSSIFNFFLIGGIVLVAIGAVQYFSLGYVADPMRMFGGASLALICLLLKALLVGVEKGWSAMKSARSSQSGKNLVNYLGGGNAKVAAEQMADLFDLHDHDYVKSFNEKCIQMAANLNNANNTQFVEIIRNNSVSNLSELVVLELNAFAAPPKTPVMYTKADFGSQVSGFLRERGIPEHYVTGDNRTLTEPQPTQDTDLETGSVSHIQEEYGLPGIMKNSSVSGNPVAAAMLGQEYDWLNDFNPVWEEVSETLLADRTQRTIFTDPPSCYATEHTAFGKLKIVDRSPGLLRVTFAAVHVFVDPETAETKCELLGSMVYENNSLEAFDAEITHIDTVSGAFRMISLFAQSNNYTTPPPYVSHFVM